MEKSAETTPDVPALDLFAATEVVRRAGCAIVDRDVLTALRERAEQAEAGRDALETTIKRVRERLDWLIANGFGATTDTLVSLRTSLDTRCSCDPRPVHIDDGPSYPDEDCPVHGKPEFRASETPGGTE